MGDPNAVLVGLSRATMEQVPVTNFHKGVVSTDGTTTTRWLDEAALRITRYEDETSPLLEVLAGVQISSDDDLDGKKETRLLASVYVPTDSADVLARLRSTFFVDDSDEGHTQDATRPLPEPKPSSYGMADHQRKMLFALLGDLGIADTDVNDNRRRRLDLVSGLLGYQVSSFTQLTDNEAFWLINRLTVIRDLVMRP